MSDKENKGLVPELRFPEFEDGNEWNQKSFSELFEIGSGKDYKHLSKGNIPVYGSGGYMLSVNDYLYEGESPCIGRKGTIDKPIFLTGKFWTVDTLFYTYDFNECLPKFVFSLFQNINWKKHNQASGVPSLSKVIIKKIEVGIPPKIEEQQKITDCLTSIDDQITAQTKKLGILKAHKKGLMQQIFPAEYETVPKVRFPGFTGNWRYCSIQDLIDTNKLLPPKDGNHGNIHPKSSDFVEEGIPFIMASSIRNGEIDLIGCSKISKEQADNLQKGFSKTGDVLLTHKGTVGEVAIVPSLDYPYIMLTPQVTYYRVINNLKLSSQYLATAFQSTYFQSYLLTVSGGGTRAYIGITEQKKLKIWMPETIEEQQKIAELVSSLECLIKSQAKKIVSLKNYKKGLMQKLFPSVNEEESHD